MKPALICAMAAASALAACASPSATTPPGAERWPVEGIHWKLSTLPGSGLTPGSAAREANLMLQAADTRASGYNGCNRYTATYELKGEALRFKQGAATRMACAQGMDMEQAYMKALDATAAWRISGDTLALLDARQQVVAELRAGSLRYLCDNGRALFAHYDNSNPSRSQALLSYEGKSYLMYHVASGSGARYAIEQGRQPDMSLEWFTQGKEGVLSEAPLSDARTPSDLKVVARCSQQ